MQQLKNSTTLPPGAGWEQEQTEGEIRKRPEAINEIAQELYDMGVTDISQLSPRQRQKLHNRIKARMRENNPAWQERQAAMGKLTNWQRNQLLKDTRGTPLTRLPVSTIEMYQHMMHPKEEQRLLDEAIPDDDGNLVSCGE